MIIVNLQFDSSFAGLWYVKKGSNPMELIPPHEFDPITFKLGSVHPEVVDFGSEQGMIVFATAGIVDCSEDCKKAKTQLWAKRCHLWVGTR